MRPSGPNQERAPLVAALLRAAGAGALRLHTPTHRSRVDPEYGAALGKALALDLTELDETDDLRDPRGAIAEAQALAAAHFGADRTWLLVNGASVGNCAALLAVSGERRFRGSGAAGAPCAGAPRKIVVGRDAHVSVVSGLILADLEPVWVPARWDAAWEVVGPPAPEAYAAALAAHPDATAVFVTSPSYLGDPADIAAIRAAAGERPLIVDEAHGAHLPRALQAGADLVIHSAHKGLSGPTQGGYLHVRGHRVDMDRVSAALRLLQSTSPNYWILAGLDAARRHAARRNAARGHAARPVVGALVGPGAASPDEHTGRPGHAGAAPTPADAAEILRRAGLVVRQSADPARVTVQFPDGQAAYAALAERGIVAEAALPSAVLFLATELTADELERLASACRAVLDALPARRAEPVQAPPTAEIIWPPRAAALAKALELPLREAVGRICAEAACPYPPGIPVLIPGEIVTAEAVDYLARHAPDLSTVRVVADPPSDAEMAQHGRRLRHPVVEERPQAL